MWCRLHLEYLKPIAEEERKIEEAEKKAREEQERIAKELAEGKTAVQGISHCPTSIQFVDTMTDILLIYL